jgi:hypothetical protein
MTQDERRLKQIKHRRYEIIEDLKALKKELIALRQEEDTINGYKTIEREKQKRKVR